MLGGMERARLDLLLTAMTFGPLVLLCCAATWRVWVLQAPWVVWSVLLLFDVLLIGVTARLFQTFSGDFRRARLMLECEDVSQERPLQEEPHV